MTVSKRTRFVVLARDRSSCRYCGRGVSDGAVLTVDHVTPKSQGGSDAARNLIAACADCNSGRGDFPLFGTADDVPLADLLRAVLPGILAQHERDVLQGVEDRMVALGLSGSAVIAEAVWEVPS